MSAQQKKSKKPSDTKAERLLNTTVFIVDECLGRTVANELRAEGLKVEYHTDHFAPGTPDAEWLPIVGQNEWVSLTKDAGIRRNEVERRKVIAAKVRQFTLSARDRTGLEMAQLLKSNLLKMGRILKKTKAPFIAVIGNADIVVWDHAKLSESNSSERSKDGSAFPG